MVCNLRSEGRSIVHRESLCNTLNLSDMEEIESPRRSRRRERLIQLVTANGGPAQVARISNTQSSHLSAMTAGSRGLGDKLAEKLEKAFDLPAGWFDQAQSQDQTQSNVRLVGIGKRQYPVISYIQAGRLADIEEPYAPGDGFDTEWSDDVGRNGLSGWSWRETPCFQISGVATVCSLIPHLHPTPGTT